ncbi:hypothetical protein BDV95DRAFT_336247 [Massariosphaeria phaeospora]|uniref:Glycosyltransferase family 25 protein n=1 Tax=Massariosphaeria phaeospora TaxID=100035 RepID=A0A7C8MG76_9PLEO|nr:hypothetical protein BDV95DRAFT_336247 [Massariosphaeria phaeospora]
MKFTQSFRIKAFAVAVLLFIIFFLTRNIVHIEYWPLTLKPFEYGSGNATLGFQEILVVAPREAPEQLHWRKDGLLRAAAYTGLRVEIPRQPIWTDVDTEILMAKNKEMKKGYALSWLGHLNALKVAATRNTSLILEDDADWDIEIREQMPAIAEAIRNLTGYPSEVQVAESMVQDPPYGTGWDVLWLGHCGDSIVFDPPPIVLIDPTVPPYINSWEKVVAPDPQQKRYIHWSAGPICTYAYAITGHAARNILERDDHGTQAYDIWLHIMCKGRELRCVTVNPELFHHHEAAGVKETLNSGLASGESNEKEFTDNIWHSARCNSASDGDQLVTCMGKEPK